MTEPLSVERIRDALQALPEWEHAHDRIRRNYRFADFSQAFAFMTRLALLAEKQGHHPELRNVYSRVVVELTSHDAGGITERDLELARAIDALD
ncbi:MAG: 4a-hydroxytetrahydrobiopterin dehydratase [Trueperaceae bacterium]